MKGYTLFGTKFGGSVDSVFNFNEFVEHYLGQSISAQNNQFIDDLADVEDIIFSAIEQGVLFKVKGNSMTGAGIFDGDIAVVDREQKANSGDIVIAYVAGKYTVKFLETDENGNYYLKSANKAFKSIKNRDFEIFGVVTSVVRNLKKSKKS